MARFISYFTGGFLFTLAISFSLLGVLMFWPLSSRWSELQPRVDATETVFVYLSGAVISPGVYEIPSSARVHELIEMAGGFSPDADKNFISTDLNLAAGLEDKQHLLIPISKPLQPSSSTSPTGGSPSSDRININTASESQLEELPGVGPQTAKKIISARPFSSIEELLDVSGIGEAKFNQIKDLVAL